MLARAAGGVFDPFVCCHALHCVGVAGRAYVAGVADVVYDCFRLRVGFRAALI